MFHKKEEYTGPVDQYGRPLNIASDIKSREDDFRLGKVFFTSLGVVAVLVIILVFIFNYLKNNRVEIPKASLSITDWTSGVVSVEIDKSKGDLKEFSFDGGKTWQDSNVLIVDHNQELILQVKNSRGKVSKTASIVVSNIDKDSPEVYFTDIVYTAVGQEFDPKANVFVTDADSGIVDYRVDISNLDLNTPGEYMITYVVTDQVENITKKERKVIVEAVKNNYFYRSRSIKFENTQCEVECNCVSIDGPTCSVGTVHSVENPEKCCSICKSECERAVYGEWTEWQASKIIPSANLEVEMKSELASSE